VWSIGGEVRHPKPVCMQAVSWVRLHTQSSWSPSASPSLCSTMLKGAARTPQVKCTQRPIGHMARHGILWAACRSNACAMAMQEQAGKPAACKGRQIRRQARCRQCDSEGGKAHRLTMLGNTAVAPPLAWACQETAGMSAPLPPFRNDTVPAVPVWLTLCPKPQT
jgi:hypothetical protein